MEFIKVKTETVETYKSGNGWAFDIITEYDNGAETNYTAWIYHTGYGIKMFMFGSFMKEFYNRKAAFLELVLDGFDSFADEYKAEYMDE